MTPSSLSINDNERRELTALRKLVIAGNMMHLHINDFATDLADAETVLERAKINRLTTSQSLWETALEEMRKAKEIPCR